MRIPSLKTIPFSFIFLLLSIYFYLFHPTSVVLASCQDVLPATGFSCPSTGGCWCSGNGCVSGPACSAGEDPTGTQCLGCGSQQEARDCACGEGAGEPCQSATNPDGSVEPPAICQWGDPWTPGSDYQAGVGHGGACLCGSATSQAPQEPDALCVPWEYGMTCSCNGGTPGAPTLIAPANNATNLSPSGITFSWNPLPNWAYGNCPFTQVKRYELHLQNQEADQWWKRSFDDGVVCVTENNRSNPTGTTPATSCTAPSASYTELIPGDLYKWGVRAENFFGKGPYSEMWYFRIPYCTISLSPASASVMAGSNQTITANVVPASGVSIKRVDFFSSNTGVVTVNPGQDPNSPYTTSARGVSAGTAAISANAILNDNSVGCSTTASSNSNLTVVQPAAWWQVKDADVMAGGNLTSLIPSSCILPGCDPNFDLPGDGGYPGIPSYFGEMGNYDFSADSASRGLVSTPQGWLANSQTSLKKLYDFAFFKRQVPTEVTTNPLFEITSPSVNGGFFNSNGAAAKGYAWYHFDGSTYGDLTINGNVNLVGGRRVILLVEGANINIIGKVNIQTRGQGFFMVVAGKKTDGSKGNITIDQSVSSPNSPALEGIYYADNQFSTGAGTNWLYFHGSIAALGGINLQRNLTDNSDQPAEFFEYAPELMTLYPNVFKNRKIRWKEVAP